MGPDPHRGRLRADRDRRRRVDRASRGRLGPDELLLHAQARHDLADGYTLDRDPVGRDARGGAVMRRAGWVVAVMAAAVLGGCGSDDDGITEPPIGVPKYQQNTPQNTLEAMVTAYVARDS